MSRWLCDIDVHLKSTPPLRAPGTGGFVTCGCFIETYLASLYRQIRTLSTVKVMVELNADCIEPWASPDFPSPSTGVISVRWPIDISRLKDVDADEWIRIHFEEMHAAMLFLAGIQKWPLASVDAARNAVIESKYRFVGTYKKPISSPNRKYRLQLGYIMDWEWFIVEGILLNAKDGELSRKEIARYPALSGPLHLFMRGKSHWKSNQEYVFVSSDTWFEPRHASIHLKDFGII